MPAVIQVEHLRKVYGPVVAVDNVSFGVERGEIFGMVGPNGAGKTSTVECAEGLRSASSGTIRVLGMDPRGDKYYRERGILFRLQATPLRPLTILSAQMGANFLMTTVSAIILVVAGELFYNVHITSSMPNVLKNSCKTCGLAEAGSPTGSTCLLCLVYCRYPC